MANPRAGASSDTHDKPAASEPSTSPRRRPRNWQDVDEERHGLLLGWIAFTATFAIARLVTGVIRLGSESAADVTTHGVHLHHYLWGILLVAGVGVVGLGDRTARVRAYLGVVLGIGLALIVDEVALLVTLRDVYWQTAGWSSVGAAVLIIGLAGTALVFTRSGHREKA
jgi:hypothetical protein